jgi:predicted nucleotidyltransferase
VRPDVIERLEPGYAAIFDRALSTFEADERVRALWLSGSLARGEADRGSDLDLILAVRDEDHAAFVEGWHEWLAAITPTLIAREVPFVRGIFYSVAPGRERLDFVVEPVSSVPNSFHRYRAVVFDRDGLDAQVPPPLERQPDPGAIAGLVEEFFRVYGLSPVVVEREDWLAGQEGVHLLRDLLYRLFVESNAPLPPMGVKQWSRKLTPEQRAVLEALPSGAAPEKDPVIAAHEQIAKAFVREGRRICGKHEVPWPEELEAATRRYLRSWNLPALD